MLNDLICCIIVIAFYFFVMYPRPTGCMNLASIVPPLSQSLFGIGYFFLAQNKLTNRIGTLFYYGG